MRAFFHSQNISELYASMCIIRLRYHRIFVLLFSDSSFSNEYKIFLSANAAFQSYMSYGDESPGSSSSFSYRPVGELPKIERIA